MLSKFISASAILALSKLVAAQTFTDCNPQEEECGSDIALGTTIDADFTKGASKYFYEFDGTTIKYDSNGAIFTIDAETDAPTVGSHKYIFFGKIDVTIIASTGTGIVTSFVLQSDNLDEIDWEWLGGDTKQVQTNYFGKGDTTTYDRGAYHDVANPQTTVHTYTIDWTKDYVRWIIDGVQVRELLYADAQGGTRFPQTPMQIKLGSWVAGRKNAPEGTVQWAGGYTDFTQGPFVAYYKDIKITDYSNGVKGATEYVWADAPNSGSYTDITVLTGTNPGGDDDTSSTTKGSATATATPTKSATKTSEVTKTSSHSTLETKSSSAVVTKSSSEDAETTSKATSTKATTTPTTAETDAVTTPTPTNTAAPGAGFKTSFSPLVLGAALVAAVAF